MFQYKVFFSIGKEDNIHGVEFISAREVSDAYIYLLIRETVLPTILLANEMTTDFEIKRKVCTPLNEVSITDIY